MVLIILSTLTLLSFSIYYYLTRNFNYWKNRNIKGPKPVALFGNVKEAATKKISYNEVYKRIYEEYPKEKVVGIYRMTTPALLLRDLDIIKNILIKDFDKFLSRGFQISKDDVGTSLFHSDSATWKTMRSRYTPMFTSGKLKTLIPVTVECADTFMKYLNKQVEKNSELPMHAIFKRFTISAIAAAGFSLDIAPDDEQAHKRLAVIDKAIFDLNVIYEIDMMFPTALKTFNLSVFPRVVSDFFTEITKKVLDERNGKASDSNDFMDFLLGLKLQGEVSITKKKDDDEDYTMKMTDRILAAQTFQFFAAGYDTTATTLALMCYLLAIHEDVKKKLVTEIETTLKKHDNKLTYECLNEMTYLENVMTETLRIFPILEPLQRMAEEDYYVPEVDLTIRKGTIVMVSAAGLQHDPKYYPEPHKFKPERFDDPTLKEMMHLIYLPFGTGPRYCVGLRLAKLQTKAVMSRLLTEYDVVPSANTTIPLQFRPYCLMLAPKDQLPLKLVKRDNTKI